MAKAISPEDVARFMVDWFDDHAAYIEYRDGYFYEVQGFDVEALTLDVMLYLKGEL